MSEVWLVDIVGKVDVGVGLVDMGGKGEAPASVHLYQSPSVAACWQNHYFAIFVNLPSFLIEYLIESEIKFGHYSSAVYLKDVILEFHNLIYERNCCPTNFLLNLLNVECILVGELTASHLPVENNGRGRRAGG